MKNSFLSSRSFKIRARVSIGIILAYIIGALTPDARGLRLIYSVAAILSIFEVYTLVTIQVRLSLGLITRGLISVIMLYLSIATALNIPSIMLITGIILTMSSDVGAYMFGKIWGTKFIKSRPFAKISPNKSWEGILGGIIVPGLVVLVINYLFPDIWPGKPLPILAGCLAGLCAIIGDAHESALKRCCDAKDANDILKRQPGFQRVEALLGGSEGHGGYYDRLDSMSLVLLLFGAVTVLSKILPNS